MVLLIVTLLVRGNSLPKQVLGRFEVDQQKTTVRTIVKIIGSSFTRHPDLSIFPYKNSNGCSYEIFAELEALDCKGNVERLDTYDSAKDLIQAWDIVKDLRPGTIHVMEVDLTHLCGGHTVMGPSFSPYDGDIAAIDGLFSNVESGANPNGYSNEHVKSVSGRIKSVMIEKTLDGKDAAVIHLVERNDYGIVIFPELYEAYRSMILGNAYLEYTGICQECRFIGDYSKMIIVNSIAVPDVEAEANSDDENKNLDHSNRNKDVIVYLHGMESTPSTSSSAQAVKERFADYEVLVPDYRPLERSHEEIGAYLAEYIANTIARSEGEVYLIGISLGGYWAFTMGCKIPYISQSILLNPSFRCYPDMPLVPLRAGFPISIIVNLDDDVVDPQNTIDRFTGLAYIKTFNVGGHRFTNREEMLDEIEKTINSVADGL